MKNSTKRLIAFILTFVFIAACIGISISTIPIVQAISNECMQGHILKPLLYTFFLIISFSMSLLFLFAASFPFKLIEDDEEENIDMEE